MGWIQDRLTVRPRKFNRKRMVTTCSPSENRPGRRRALGKWDESVATDDRALVFFPNPAILGAFEKSGLSGGRWTGWVCIARFAGRSRPWATRLLGAAKQNT